MAPAAAPTSRDVLLDALRLYLQIHANPELSGAERHTAAAFAERLGHSGFEVVTGVGGHGVVGRLVTGDGPSVLLRAELDALPVAERTGLPYASTRTAATLEGTRTPVMHACGHDLHLAALVGAARTLAADPTWTGTLLVVGQPAEETLSGAAAMLDDGLYRRWGRPDVALAQHSAPIPAGMVAHGDVMTACSLTLRIVVAGRGGHPSMPHLSVDPTPVAAAIVLALQQVRAQQLDPADPAVLSVGQLSAGSTAGVVAEHAVISVTLRAFSERSLSKLRSGVERVVRGTCAAAGVPGEPVIETVADCPVGRSDEQVVARLRSAHGDAFGAERVGTWRRSLAAEDFPRFAAGGVPTGYWMLGVVSPQQWRAAGHDPDDDRAAIAGNHSPRFAPCARLALPTGIQALSTAALAWLKPAG